MIKCPWVMTLNLIFGMFEGPEQFSPLDNFRKTTQLIGRGIVEGTPNFVSLSFSNRKPHGKSRVDPCVKIGHGHSCSISQWSGRTDGSLQTNRLLWAKQADIEEDGRMGIRFIKGGNRILIGLDLELMDTWWVEGVNPRIISVPPWGYWQIPANHLGFGLDLGCVWGGS
jgi:hypothetical protein